LDLATLIGLLGAFIIVFMSMIMSGDIAMFVNAPSLLIVIVGTIFVVLMKFGLGQFLGAFKVAGKAFMFKIDDPADLIDRIRELADMARKGGLLALEEAEVENEFLQRGLQLLVDGHDQEVVRQMLGKDRDMAEERHDISSKIFSAMGDVGLPWE